MNSRREIYVLWCFNLYVTYTSIQVFGEKNNGYDNYSKCEYPAIYNFGDSNSDTGAYYATFTGLQPPYGMSFIGSLSGRASDGRLIIDFITEELKLPYLSAYLNSVGSNYRHGANFAVGGAPIRPGGGYSPINLALQVSQFKLFKSHTKILFDRLSDNRTEAPFRSGLPRNEEFSKALYTIDIGQNDLAYGFQYTSEENVKRSTPDILSQFSQAVKELYNEGARVFWIHNTGPIGCLPFNYLYYEGSKEGNLDANGCIKPENKIAQEFNKKLKDQVIQLRTKLSLAKFTYVDMYKAKYELITNAKSQGDLYCHQVSNLDCVRSQSRDGRQSATPVVIQSKSEGFVSLLDFCCGSYTGYHVKCGQKEIIKGTVKENNACKNPSQHISWDGLHYTERANQLIAEQVIYGSFSDPPVSVGNACF